MTNEPKPPGAIHDFYQCNINYLQDFYQGIGQMLFSCFFIYILQMEHV